MRKHRMSALDASNSNNYWPYIFFPIIVGVTKRYLDKSSNSQIEEKISELINEKEKWYFLIETVFSISGHVENERFCYKNGGVYEVKDKKRTSEEPLLVFPFDSRKTWFIDKGETKAEVECETKYLDKKCICLKYSSQNKIPTRREWYVEGIGLAKWIEYYESHEDKYEIVL